MIHTIRNKWFSGRIEENGHFSAVANQAEQRRFVDPGELFSLILRDPNGQEICLHSDHQDPPHILTIGTVITIFYSCLRIPSDELDFKLLFTVSLEQDKIRMTAALENNSDYTAEAFQSIAVPEKHRLAPLKKGKILHLPPRYYTLGDLKKCSIPPTAGNAARLDPT